MIRCQMKIQTKSKHLFFRLKAKPYMEYIFLQPLQEKHVVPLPSDSADEYVLSSDVEEDEVMFLEKLTKKGK